MATLIERLNNHSATTTVLLKEVTDLLAARELAVGGLLPPATPNCRLC